MDDYKAVDIDTLILPSEIIKWIGSAAVYESSGHSSAKTLYIDHDDGAYLKIADHGFLHRAYVMQGFFHQHHLSSPVLDYISSDRDYLLIASVKGEDGTSKKHISNPKKLSDIFARSLRFLHDTDISNCPIEDKIGELIKLSETASFSKRHLDGISEYIGMVDSEKAANEIAQKSKLLKCDVLIHGDYCLPNVLYNDWNLEGFIDLADSGAGDRHYDLAMGLWTLYRNFKTYEYGWRFLDTYGWGNIDEERLRVCGLLVAIE